MYRFQVFQLERYKNDVLPRQALTFLPQFLKAGLQNPVFPFRESEHLLVFISRIVEFLNKIHSSAHFGVIILLAILVLSIGKIIFIMFCVTYMVGS